MNLRLGYWNLPVVIVDNVGALGLEAWQSSCKEASCMLMRSSVRVQFH